jgi:hypothetical protein
MLLTIASQTALSQAGISLEITQTSPQVTVAWKAIIVLEHHIVIDYLEGVKVQQYHEDCGGLKRFIGVGSRSRARCCFPEPEQRGESLPTWEMTLGTHETDPLLPFPPTLPDQLSFCNTALWMPYRKRRSGCLVILN